MRRPSAYCATSSGIAIESSRVSTQPVCLDGVRTRLQPSVFTGGVLWATAAASASSAVERESSTQSGGSDGGLGGGGSGTLSLRSRFLGAGRVFFGARGISGVRGASVRGNSTDTSTSNRSFSLSCTKLGDDV